MAANAITIDTLTKDASAGSVTTLAALDTDTGVYLDIEDKDFSKIVFLGRRDSTTETASIVIGVGTDFSGVSLGSLTVSLSTGTAETTQQVHVIGPLDWSRFKDTDERINITCTGSTTVEAVGAIVLP